MDPIWWILLALVGLGILAALIDRAARSPAVSSGARTLAIGSFAVLGSLELLACGWSVVTQSDQLVALGFAPFGMMMAAVQLVGVITFRRGRWFGVPMAWFGAMMVWAGATLTAADRRGSGGAGDPGHYGSVART